MTQKNSEEDPEEKTPEDMAGYEEFDFMDEVFEFK